LHEDPIAMRVWRRLSLGLCLLALAWSPAARALFDSGITHTKVGEPRIAAAVDPALAAIGVPMSMSAVPTSRAGGFASRRSSASRSPVSSWRWPPARA